MSLVINTNTASMSAQRQIMRSGEELDRATTRLSSGKRINAAADDAAGLAISSRMTSQVRGLDQAIRNANDGISLIQVADGALNETTNMLQRIRELSIQSVNGVYSDSDRATLNAEVKQLLSQIDLVAKNTEFNGVAILNGSAKKIDLQVGADNGQIVSFNIPAVGTKSLGLSSSSGDLIGAQMKLDGDGTFSSAISQGAIQINGMGLESITGSTQVKDILSVVNKTINGVEASVVTTVVADVAGTGVIQGSNTLTINTVNLDGGKVSYQISNTATLEDLVAKIQDKTGGVINASIDDKGKLVLTSTNLSRISLVDKTGGVATGISVGSNPDPDVNTIIQNLQNFWVSESENLINTYFGLAGQGANITLKLQTIGDGSDGAGGASASVYADPNALVLNIDMEDFNNVVDGNGPDTGGGVYGDRVIAHEMVHALMAINMASFNSMPGWFVEGTAELIHGADSRVVGVFSSIDTAVEFDPLLKTTSGSPSTSAGYAASYVAVKQLHEIVVANGGTGINELFTHLKTGISLDAALVNVKAAHAGITEFSNLATFETYIKANGHTKAIAINAGGAGGDTGSIAGSDYGHSAKTALDILPNTATQAPTNLNLIIPAEYGGGSISQNASLVLKSTDGNSIAITKGISATDEILEAIGFLETQGSKVIGSDLNSTEQGTALKAGDLFINGIDIGTTNAIDGLQGKVNAINAKTDETGVTASVYAKSSLKYDSTVRTEVIGNNVVAAPASETIGFNGVGIAILAGDSLQTVSGKINAANSVTGVTSYVDDSGKIHFYSDQNINFSASALNTALGLAYGPASTGSLNIRGTQVSLTNIYNIDTVANDINATSANTGVRATLNKNGELQLESETGFSIKLGNTNGLKTFQALGINFTTAASGAKLSDTNNNDLLTDESFSVNARLVLEDRSGSPISVRVATTNATTATGLIEQNAGYSDFVTGSSLSTLNVANVSSAKKAIVTVDVALKSINDARSNLGAVNNRLDFTIANLTNVSEKTTAALSRIVDTDFAQETAKLSRSTVLQQAAQAMLAQANQRPNQVLSLLR